MSTRVLLRGGHVHTPSDAPYTAILVDGNRVGWLGDEDAASQIADGCDRVVELGGRLVTPAFVDAHVHLAQTGLAQRAVDLRQAVSVADALDRLAAHARASDATVVMGYGWDETEWPERRAFTRLELDRAVGVRPAYVSRVDVHSAVVSSTLLDAVAAHGEPVEAMVGFSPGVLTREAHHAARDAVRQLTPAADRIAAIRSALRTAASRGVGMVHEMGAPHINTPADFKLIQAVDEPAPEVVGYWGELETDLVGWLGLAGAAGDLCADGSLGSRTAALEAPYADGDTSGHLYLSAGEVAEHVVACMEANLQAGFHVIGDRAVAEVVAGFERAAEKVGVPAMVAARHRLEHLEMVTAEQVAVLARLGVTASVQPVFDGLWGGEAGMYAARLGPERAAAMNPFAMLNRAGVPLAFGSDSPVTPVDPWAAVRAAAWHHTEGARLSVRAGFNAHTRGGWRAARRDEGGLLEVGEPASLAVWDARLDGLPDLHPDLDLPTCLLTLVAGRVAFEEPGAL